MKALFWKQGRKGEREYTLLAKNPFKRSLKCVIEYIEKYSNTLPLGFLGYFYLKLQLLGKEQLNEDNTCSCGCCCLPSFFFNFFSSSSIFLCISSFFRSMACISSKEQRPLRTNAYFTYYRWLQPKL